MGYPGKLIKLTLPRQPPLISTLHRTSRQLRSNRPVRPERPPPPTRPLPVLRQAGVSSSFEELGMDTVGTVRRTLARNVRHGSIPVPRRLVSRVEKQPDDAQLSEVVRSGSTPDVFTYR